MKCVKYFPTIFIILLIFSICNLSAQKKEFIASIDQDSVQRVEIIAGSYYFDPNYIIVKVNVPVEIKIKKDPGITPHNIIIKAPDAGIDFAEDLSKETKIIRFIPYKAGKYPFYCDKRFLFFKSHRARGMEGILEVRE